MLQKIYSILSIIEMARASLVIDSKSQGNINVNDYCPKMKHCPEGSHVLCMYEQNKMGPLCTDAKEIPPTRDKIQKILDVTNMIRSRIARGKERGKDDELLPRGYGIFRLKWDPVLSAFAQVLTNQCVLGHDFCRATNKFPDPSQIAGMFRYKLNWDPVKGKDLDFEPGFNNKKVMYALNRVLNSWYDHRTSVTPNHTTAFPDYDSNPSEMRGRLYLRMVYGSATHIGCGVTAYSQFNFKHDVKTNDGSFLLVICNLSASPHRGTSVFNTVPPGDTTVLSNPCGCPAGSVGDDMCLCVDAEDDPHHKESDRIKHTCPDGMDCDPAMMVLPIFTIEDAPPEKLIHTSYMNATKRKNGMDHYLDRSSDNEWQDLTRKSGLDMVSQLAKYPAAPGSRHGGSLQNSKKVGQYVPTIPQKQAFFEKPNESSKTLIDSKNIYLEDLRKKYLNQNAALEDLRHKYFDQNANLEDLKNKYLKQNANLVASRMKNANIEALQAKSHEKSANIEPPRTKYLDKNLKQESPRPAYAKNAIHRHPNTVNFDKNQNLDNQRTAFDDTNRIERQENIEHKPIQRVTRKKESIFSRPAKFQLPLNVYDHIKLEHRVERKDVVPRKDFTKAKQLLDKYLYDKHPIVKGVSKNSNQDPEKIVTEKEWMVTERLEDHMSEPKNSMKNKYTNSSVTEDQQELEIYSERNINKRIYDNDRNSKRRYGERLVSKSSGLQERQVIRNTVEPKDKYDNKRYSERGRYSEDDNDMRSDRRSVVGFDRSRTRSSRRDNVMSRDRRQFYQDKLDNLERRLQTRMKTRKNTPATHMRPVKSENQMDLYGRARFAHGY